MEKEANPIIVVGVVAVIVAGIYMGMRYAGFVTGHEGHHHEVPAAVHQPRKVYDMDVPADVHIRSKQRPDTAIEQAGGGRPVR